MIYRGKNVKYQTFEKAKGYETIVLFVEIEDVQHSGFLIKKGDKILPKGEIAKAVRDAKIEGVEMAVAPPADTNALMMLRITQDPEKILDKVLEVVFDFLEKRGFL
uniref:Uncharacterized protein n=1 Tax=Geoglobus ahangari TaxID=113653 RepID=A0A7C3UBL7_9EURY